MAKPPESEPSTLWRVSSFDRARDAAAAVQGWDRQTLLSTTLQAELNALERRHVATDVLEVVAACLRAREAALIYLLNDAQVWPVTIFPVERIYHSPRTLSQATALEIGRLSVMRVEPAGLRPPGHAMHERVGKANHYHRLSPGLWRLALNGPRARLLSEIGGTAAYRVLRSPASEGLSAPGAIGAAVNRLRDEPAPLKAIARWPGMSTERAAAMLNALYLTANLLVSRTHRLAKPEPVPGFLSRWLG